MTLYQDVLDFQKFQFQKPHFITIQTQHKEGFGITSYLTMLLM